MKKEIILASIAFFFLSLLLTGCTGYYSSVKDSLTVKDSLALHGSCIIAGRIIDGDTDEPVRGANVVAHAKPIRAVSLRTV